MTTAQIFAARGYLRAIRNPKKRAYAESYYAWRNHCRVTSEQFRRPEPDHNGLSYMAAQAVRIMLDSLAGGTVS